MMKKLFTTRGTDWEKVLNKGRRILHQNPEALSVLDKIAEILHLTRASGVTTDFLLDLGFSRGLEYYTGMIFEVFVPGLDVALGGGGRYDKLVELFGGESTPAVGCAPGIDRMALAMEKTGLFQKNLLDIEKLLIISINEEVVDNALEIAYLLRSQGIPLHYEVVGRSVTAALSYANKKRYTAAIIVGPKEVTRNAVILRDLHLNTQQEIPIDRLVEEIKHR
jgi:histidyl-tRNA synthetase